MKHSYTIRIAWERFDIKKAAAAVILVLVCCFSALFFTARPATAGKQTAENICRDTYKYYTAITVRQGDTLWSIAEEQLENKDTAAKYKGRRAYMQEIVTLNDLQNGNYLLAGQKLIVPYYSQEYKS